jgi:starvation-inducible DNA-binding protein
MMTIKAQSSSPMSACLRLFIQSLLAEHYTEIAIEKCLADDAIRGERFSGPAFPLGGRQQLQLKENSMKTESLARKQTAPVGYGHTSDLFPDAVAAISANLRQLLADVFALYLKTKNFHWHMTGRHFRDYHLLLDEQAEQIFSMTDDIAERARKLGRSTLRSISDIASNQRLKDNNEAAVAPADMILELAADNQRLIEFMRQSHELCDQHNDVATTSLIEVWIDQAERRVWFLSEVANGQH